MIFKKIGNMGDVEDICHYSAYYETAHPRHTPRSKEALEIPDAANGADSSIFIESTQAKKMQC
jgi:hypothetical protein